MKNRDAVMSYAGSAFLQKEIIPLPFRAVILMTSPSFRRDSPHTWHNVLSNQKQTWDPMEIIDFCA